MEVKNKWLLNLIKIGLDIVWYVCIFLTCLALFYFIKSAVGRINHLFSIPIVFQGVTLEHYFPTFTVGDSSITTQASRGVLIITTPNSFAEVPMIVNFAVFRLLFLAIIYNLRKLFGTFYRNEPFEYQNITRLKIIALYIALFSPLGIIYAVMNYLVLRSYTSKFFISWSAGGYYLGIAAIVYVTAEIFRYGFDLKKENEEFI